MEALVGKRIQTADRSFAGPGRERAGSPPGSSDGMHAFNQVIDSVRKYRRLVVMMVTVGTLLVTG